MYAFIDCKVLIVFFTSFPDFFVLLTLVRMITAKKTISATKTTDPTVIPMIAPVKQHVMVCVFVAHYEQLINALRVSVNYSPALRPLATGTPETQNRPL